MNWRKLYDPYALVPAIPVSIVVVVGSLLSYQSHVILQRHLDLVVHTYDVLTITQDVRLAAQETEVAQRGFVITGDKAFLESYDKAWRAEIPSELSKLSVLVKDSRQQLRRVMQLKNLLHTRFQELNTTLDARERLGFEAARLLVANRSGKVTMDRVGNTISEITSTERKLLSVRTKEVQRDERRILGVIAVTAIISTLLRLAMAFWRQRVLESGR